MAFMGRLVQPHLEAVILLPSNSSEDGVNSLDILLKKVSTVGSAVQDMGKCAHFWRLKL
jgi:hypothetical protein